MKLLKNNDSTKHFYLYNIAVKPRTYTSLAVIITQLAGHPVGLLLPQNRIDRTDHHTDAELMVDGGAVRINIVIVATGATSFASVVCFIFTVVYIGLCVSKP